MRGLTNEERAALQPNCHTLTPVDLNERLRMRGLLYVAWETDYRRHLEPTSRGLLALRLDAAARALSGVMA